MRNSISLSSSAYIGSIHEEEAKAILQSRFQAVNDEVKFFENVVNPIPSKTIMENGKVPVPLSIDRKKTLLNIHYFWIKNKMFSI